MSTARTGMKGHAPKVVVGAAPGEYLISKEELAKVIPSLANPEAQKYIRAWEVPEYRIVSPGENQLQTWFNTANPNGGETFVDWGCGTGRASLKVSQKGLDVTMVDFAPNCLDKEVEAAAKDSDNLRFIEHDLTQKIILPSKYGYCTDVMEHVPEEQVDAVLDTILDNSQHVFFQISTMDDVMGDHEHIDAELHVTIKDYWWWMQKFLDKRCVIHHSNDLNGAVIFYVTGFGSGLRWDMGRVNTDDEAVIANMEANAELGLPQAMPHEQQDVEIMLVCGGPTINDYEEEIFKNRASGMPLITVNGSYNWCIERGMKPSLQVMIDAREFNQRFTEQVPGITDHTKYMMASQCHPDAVKNCPPDRTWLFQVSLSDELLPEVKRIYGKMYQDWYPCPGGSTVATRALCLLRMLGLGDKIHVYGMDSCLFPDRHHHGYEQAENDDPKTLEVTVGMGTIYEKTFLCAPWMVYQAKDWMNMVPTVLKDIQMNVAGDGMIAYMIETGAAMAAFDDDEALPADIEAVKAAG